MKGLIIMVTQWHRQMTNYSRGGEYNFNLHSTRKIFSLERILSISLLRSSLLRNKTGERNLDWIDRECLLCKMDRLFLVKTRYWYSGINTTWLQTIEACYEFDIQFSDVYNCYEVNLAGGIVLVTGNWIKISYFCNF